jgi:RNA polymerase primary sigma factor
MQLSNTRAVQEKGRPNGRTKSFDPLSMYLHDISKLGLLKREEEIELARRIQRGDKEAERKMVEGNLRFVVSVANKYRGRGIPLGDLINEGNMGLIRAARKFDPTKGIKFITYAVWWVNTAIRHALSKQNGVISLPYKQTDIFYKISRKQEEISKNLEKEPSVDDLADSLDLSVEDIEKNLQANRPSLSLDVSISENSKESFVELLERENPLTVDKELLEESLSREIDHLIDKLDPRQRKIIEMRFGLNGDEVVSLREIGKRLGLSGERIRQIEKEALDELEKIARERSLDLFLN